MSKTKVTFSKSKTGPSGGTQTKKNLIPALSVPLKPPKLDPAIERLKKKAIRRNAPPGEDIKKIKEIIKQLNQETITVQEFVGLISPYTGDAGRELKSVMEEDLRSFRKMAKLIYDTMTQDVDDVLANEQITITAYFNERYTLNMDKMMRTIDTIYRYVPNFDFELFYKDKDYLNKLFPLPTSDDNRDPEEIEMQKRQAAFHRLEWMRSEGVRLTKENTQLQARLKELKQLQKQEVIKAQQQEQEAEMEKNKLEATQNRLQDRLEDLNESMEKSIVENEQAKRMMVDAKLTEKPRSKAQMPKRKVTKKAQPWSVKTARDIEKAQIEETVANAASAISTTSVVSKTGAVRKRARPRAKVRTAAPRDVSPFHFSPIKTPPAGPSAERQTSPFHYSPPKSPAGPNSPPQQYPPPREPLETRVPTRTVRIESTTTIVEQAPPEQFPGRVATGRRNLAPRDSWRGFQ